MVPFSVGCSWDICVSSFKKLGLSEQSGIALHAAKTIFPVFESVYPRKTKVLKEALKQGEIWLSGGGPYELATAQQSVFRLTEGLPEFYKELGRRIAHFCQLRGAPEGVDPNSCGLLFFAADNCEKLHLPEDWVADLYEVTLGKASFPSEWRTSLTQEIARGILSERDFSDMPILGDALEDLGCWDEKLLHHLRNDRKVWTPYDWVLNQLGREHATTLSEEVAKC